MLGSLECEPSNRPLVAVLKYKPHKKRCWKTEEETQVGTDPWIEDEDER